MPFRAAGRGPGLVFLLLAGTLVAGCQGSDRDDQSSGFRLSFTFPSAPTSTEVVFVRLLETRGSLITLDVVGRDIAAPLDGLDLAMEFDATVLEAVSVSSETFLGTCGLARPDNSILLCADSISQGTANASGVVTFGASPTGPSPAPETVSGEVVLASVTFRARSRGESAIFFRTSGPSISRVTSGPDPQGAAAVSFQPSGPGPAKVEVRR